MLLDKWNNEGISTGTLKNRMSAPRWGSGKIGKDIVIHAGTPTKGMVAALPV
ncbi:hypothetical protein RBA41_29425 [Massilia sp. CCM 9210]|uniref:hypothetical protein n=1 Tax=Massilia scottii TaxID=3057166 RepID=UPI0027969C98|nr:hypothetical protein [Massilia sp. CCM 9210]MDQ1817436.1 hypothetical protein [Massilia sp. CCM 9210]